jgi:hypothetical protein
MASLTATEGRLVIRENFGRFRLSHVAKYCSISSCDFPDSPRKSVDGLCILKPEVLLPIFLKFERANAISTGRKCSGRLVVWFSFVQLSI